MKLNRRKIIRKPQVQIPKRGRGNPSKAAKEAYNLAVSEFCDEIKVINSRLDFKVSSRGWCYILEDHGLLKSDFNKVQDLINDCRKTGDLPLDICAKDETRIFNCIESVADNDPQDEAAELIDYILNTAWQNYNSESFWEDQNYYVQMVVEKIDLIGLFLPVCEEYKIPIANARGWSDLWLRADMMQRFSAMEEEVKLRYFFIVVTSTPQAWLLISI